MAKTTKNSAEKENAAGSRSIRALEVLEHIVSSDKPLSVGGLVEATGLPRATLHRLLNLLKMLQKRKL